jgi:hypothetical protein
MLLLHYLSNTHIPSKFVLVTDFQMLITHIFQIFHLESTSNTGTYDEAFFDILQNDGNGLVAGGKCSSTTHILTWWTICGKFYRHLSYPLICEYRIHHYYLIQMFV